jgi:histidinol phosphatase-like PHP family hydrolase
MSRCPEALFPRALIPGAIPRLDLHLHTTWTDGAATVAQTHQRAVELGLEAILFSEHARRTSGDWFPRFAAEVRAVSDDRCRALVGVETKVDSFDGALDSCDEILAECDLVMASVHRFPGEDGIVKGWGDYTPAVAIETERRLALAVLDNPAVDILGHPMAMSLSRFRAEPPWECFLEIIEKCARVGVAFEINARYHRDLWRLADACAAHGAPISLGSNAHCLDEIGRVVELLEGRDR